MIKISIARDFAVNPGGRKRVQGVNSGEAFREEILEPAFESGSEIIEIDMDGLVGYAPSFLEEIFGGMVRKFGYEKVHSRIKISALEDPLVIARIEKAMKKSAESKGS